MKSLKFDHMEPALDLLERLSREPRTEDLFVYVGGELIWASYASGQTEWVRLSQKHERALRRLMRQRIAG